MDLGLECDLDVEVEIEPQAERVALAAAAAALLGLLPGDTTECVRDAANKTAGCLADISELEVIEGALSALLLLLLLLALAASSLGRSVILRLLAVRLVDLRGLLLLPLGLLLGAASGRHCDVGWRFVCETARG
jgi:hypothetical protein